MIARTVQDCPSALLQVPAALTQEETQAGTGAGGSAWLQTWQVFCEGI